MGKRIVLSFFVLVLLFSIIPLSTHANYEDIVKTMSNGEVQDENQRELMYDDEGNKIEIEYVWNERNLTVYTYVNDELVDYAVREKVGTDGLSENITYFQVEVSPEVQEIEDIVEMQEESKDNHVVLEVQEYKTSEIVTLVEEKETTLNIDNSGGGFTTQSIDSGYTYITSAQYMGYTGYLYGAPKTTKMIKKFMFDFKRDIAISIIGAAITTIFSTVIVGVVVLLSSLGIGVINAFTTDSLNGYYDATETTYRYMTKVKERTSYQVERDVNVIYYNSKNGKKLTRYVNVNKSSNTVKINTAIFAYFCKNNGTC
ncbi:hypothetical protein [Sutcliffiella sp. NC1]|uniref:hypothetical protein n=1 Tax=Sutcliffiella sp. NC1 TaxID=3004096 RepID=UPI0022DE8B69|nr:hypothetical protein [Sutcliffiella sp. NC1]WBL16860.1 hypothetical protein O1A01_09575 [Sutcliffiella sp. NC1]